MYKKRRYIVTGVDTSGCAVRSAHANLGNAKTALNGLSKSALFDTETNKYIAGNDPFVKQMLASYQQEASAV